MPLPLLRQLIGMALRRARQRQGRTLRDVAADAGVSVAYLSELERGRKEASSEVLAAVCRALGWQISDLLDDVQDDLARLRGREEVRPVLSRPAPTRVPTGARRPYEGRLCTVSPVRPGGPSRRSTGPGRGGRVAHLERVDACPASWLGESLGETLGERLGERHDEIPAAGYGYRVPIGTGGSLSPRC